jgi:hypothetical protein
MHDQQGNRSSGSIAYPAHRVTGAVPAAEVAAVREDLVAAGFAADRIEVFVGEEDAQRFRDLAESPGVWGSVRRFALSLGSDLDLARDAEAELDSGDALVEVTVHDEAEKYQIRDVLVRHGGHFITYFGSWTIETLA